MLLLVLLVLLAGYYSILTNGSRLRNLKIHLDDGIQEKNIDIGITQSDIIQNAVEFSLEIRPVQNQELYYKYNIITTCQYRACKHYTRKNIENSRSYEPPKMNRGP